MSAPDYGPEFVAEVLRKWTALVGVQTAYIEPSSPWENGYIESSTQDYGMNCSTEIYTTR